MPEIRQWHASNVAPVWHLFSAKCGANLLCGALLARFVLIMGINAQRHIDRSVSCEILNLLDIQPALKQSCDVGMPELVRMNLEIQRADDLGVWSSCPKNGRIINRTVFNHLKQTLEPAFVWGDRIFEKCGIRRDEGGDGGKTLEIRGKRRLSARDGGANYQQS